MTSIRFLEFLPFLLLLLLLLSFHQVNSKEAEPVFRAEGRSIEMGYCFGVDYIVVYRSSPEGDQLLGNSSADDNAVGPPADLRGRILINAHQHLLGLQISNLTHMDSGNYRRECWQNQTRVSEHTQHLSVCDEEVKSEEIIVNQEVGVSELRCKSSSIGLEGTSVRWYHELYPSYKRTLFLDSSVSLQVEELQGVVAVRDDGALLVLDNSLLKNNLQFFCLVSKGKSCLSYQNMYLKDHSDNREIFASQGDRVVLSCPADGDDQQWDTPLGRINGSSGKAGKMSVSSDDKSEAFSLVIPAFSDELSGEYACISSSLELQYLLTTCHKKETRELFGLEDGDILLNCDVGEGDSKTVQWHRQEPSGEHELICDSNDMTVPIPEDLVGRLTLSKNGSTLVISHLEREDAGVYWCVVLGFPLYLEEDNGYEIDYDEEYTENDESTDDGYWHDEYRCVYKQETILHIKTSRRDLGFPSVTSDPETSTTDDPSAASNVTAYAVGAGLGCALTLGVIVAVIAIKKRAKGSTKLRKGASRSGPNTDRGLQMTVDPACTERLTHNDEYDG